MAGLQFYFNHGARVKVPAGNWRVKITGRDALVTLYDVSADNVLVFSTKKHYVNFVLEIYLDNSRWNTIPYGAEDRAAA